MQYQTNTDVYLHLPRCPPGAFHEWTLNAQSYFPLWKGETYTVKIRKQQALLTKKHISLKNHLQQKAEQFPDFSHNIL